MKIMDIGNDPAKLMKYIRGLEPTKETVKPEDAKR